MAGKQSDPAFSNKKCVDYLHFLITHFVECDDLGTGEAAWAADALVLINVLYPKCSIVAKDALMHAVSKGPPACQACICSNDTDDEGVACLSDVPNVSSEEAAELRSFWAAFCRSDPSKCAWKAALAPFLVLVLEHGGSHKTTPLVINKFRTGLECAVRAVWLVYSPDGIRPPPPPHPASEAPTMAMVSRHHIDPVFVGNVQKGSQQRGSCVGLKPHSYRQVLAELLGASISGVNCNVTINEGGLSLRVSSDPTIMSENGKERTEKSISPVQTEGDMSAYGTREDKIAGACMQKSAYDSNALRCMPLYLAIEAPRPERYRVRGVFGNVDGELPVDARKKHNGEDIPDMEAQPQFHLPNQEITVAKNIMEEGASSTLSQRILLPRER
jgi:hypothetical protein